MARTKSGIGRMARRKGTSGELKVAKKIAEAIGLPYGEVRRTPNSGALIERGDLRLSEDAMKRFPWFVEVKNRQGWDFFSALANPGAWPPALWYEDAETKAVREYATGFSPRTLPVLLVMLVNHRPALAMVRVGSFPTALMSGIATMEVGNYHVFTLDAFLKEWVQKFGEIA